MKLNKTTVINAGRTPDWIMTAVKFYVDLFDLQEFRIHVHYATLKSINNFLRRNKTERLTAADKAAVIIDSTYLIAHILLISPVKQDENGYAVIAHEMAHIHLRHRIMNRVKTEVLYPTRSFEEEIDAALLNIEERSSEQIVNILDRLDVFTKLAKT